ncbi:PPC domain-containing protein [Okeanomitos corallinicola TIOX110]|uniref:PPC domain-containing protein n=1 Tax=Okeanomitos corallinicola TIOX110 TaxID=3133117 RepID=A0ABZ2UXB9_9CYAN
MNKTFKEKIRKIILIPVTILTMSLSISTGIAQENNSADNNKNLYKPIPLNPSGEVTDMLTIKDIPTGQGGFARDYSIKLEKGDNLAIDLSSENFDTIITLLAPNGATVGENDDGPDGTSNSLLFTRITETGNYIVRVRSFGETGVGNFKLKVTKLIPVK